MTVQAITKLLSTLRLPLHDEKRLQAEIARAFEQAGIEAEREVRLNGADIIDFVVGDIGIEVKIKGQKRAIYNQIKRYAAHERLNALILVTNVPSGFPAQMNGKPVHFVNLARAWL